MDQPTQWHLPTGSHCSEQCELRGSHCSAPMVALLGAVRSPGLRSAKGRASHCENPGVAVRKFSPRTAKSLGSHCEAPGSHCSQQCEEFGRTVKGRRFAVREILFALRNPGLALPKFSHCESNFSQCEAFCVAVRTDGLRTAKSLGSHCEGPGVAVRGKNFAVRTGWLRSANRQASQCEKFGVAVRRARGRSARPTGRTARGPGSHCKKQCEEKGSQCRVRG